MPSCGDIWNRKKTIIRLVASMRTKGNMVLTIVYDRNDNANGIYIANWLTKAELINCVRKGYVL